MAYEIGQRVEPSAWRPPSYPLCLRDGGVAPDHADLTWYCARAATRREATAEHSLENAGMAFYFPMLIRKGTHGRREITVRQSLFEGYGFVGLAPAQSLYDLPHLEGVHGVIQFGRDRPRAIPFAMVAALLQCEIAGHFDRTVEAETLAFEKDEIVRIVDGHFAGFNASILRLPARKRVLLLVSLFGRLTETEVDLTAIRKVA